MAAISPTEEQTIIRRVKAAYGFTPATEKHIASVIYETRVDAIIQSYKHAASVVHSRVEHEWMPPEALLKRQAQEAYDHAQSISETFQESLESQTKQFIAGWQEETRARPQDQDQQEEDDEKKAALTAAALAALLAALAVALLDWENDWLAWKVPQIANVETVTGANVGTLQFLGDLSGNYIQVGADVDVTGLRVCVVPEESSKDFCADYAGKVYDWTDYGLLPTFPAHVNCIHRVMLLVGGVLQEMP